MPFENSHISLSSLDVILDIQPTENSLEQNLAATNVVSSKGWAVWHQETGLGMCDRAKMAAASAR